ncbi:MAG: mechanosensitive ion channel family protein [Vicinamibacterales bacterium]
MTGVFSRVDRWAQAASPAGRRLPDLLPAPLQAMGPHDLAWWQWLALPLFVAAALVVGRVLGAISRAVLQRAFRRTPTRWDERWLDRVAPALTVLWGAAVFRAAMPWLELHDAAHGFVTALLTAVGVITVFWALWRSVDVVVEFTVDQSWGADASARSMIIVGGNLLKTAVLVVGGVSTAAAFGYPVATVVAGLGIGGIAFAFGAQKTVENLFGSIALAADQPLRVGDVVKVEGVEGQVEQIGARSTRLRTADRTLVTIPNGRLADSRIESLAARDRLRMTTTVMLAYGTTEAQVRQVIAGIDERLRAQPLVWPDVVIARLANLGPASIDIEVMCWFQTADFEAFRSARQDVLLAIIGVVEQAGARFVAPPAPAVIPPAAP